MIEYFADIYRTTASILKGLRVTLLTLLKPAITVQYPTEKLVPYEQYRGVLLFDPETCIACNLCVKACPSMCIALANAVSDAGKKVAKVDWYSIDFAKCNFCKLCEEACPTKPKSVWHSRDYELTFSSRQEAVRCWKQGFALLGCTYDWDTKEFKPPLEQLQIQTVKERRS